jgi:integrase
MQWMATRKAKLTKSYIDGIEPEKGIFRVWDTEVSGYHLRVSPSGAKSFVLRYHFNGKNLDYTIARYGDITPTEARQRAIKLKGQARADGVDLLAARKASKAAEREEYRRKKQDELKTLGSFYDKRYKSWAEANIKTADEVNRLIQKDFKFLRQRKLSDINPWVVSSWSRKSKESGLSNSTINRRVTVLKSILSKAVEWGVIEVSPLAGMKREAVDTHSIVRFLDADEERRLREALDARQQKQREERFRYNQWLRERGRPAFPRLEGMFTDYLKPMVLLALNTGLRRGELFRLTWESVNLPKALMTVTGESSKSGKTRHIPLNSEALRTLKGWRELTGGNGLVFPSPKTGKRLDNINKSWSALVKSAEITNFRFHDLRHHFASQLVMSGVDLNTVRELLGHRSIETTLRYAHLAPEHKAAAVEVLCASPR